MSHALRLKIRQGIKNFVRRFGVDIVEFPKLEGPYEKIHIKSFYAPWKNDEEFNRCFSSIQTHTLVDKHRCYELWDLVEQSSKIEGCLVEIGVWRGGTGALIAKKAELCQIKDPVYLCDTFKGIVKATERDGQYRGGEHSDTSLEITQKLLERLHLKNVHLLEGIFPEDTGFMLGDRKISFCHVDVDVYNSARDIINWIWPKLSVGGIVVFDDYGFPTTPGIRDFVNERKYEADKICLHNLNGHSVWIKLY